MTPSPSSLRDRRPLSLSVAEAGPERAQPAPGPGSGTMPWWVAALGGGLAAAAVGWMLLAAVVLLGWLADMVGPMGVPLGVATEFWFSVHGGAAVLGGSTWTLVPLGLTLVQVVCVSGVAAFAARQRRDGRWPGWRPAVRVAAVVCLGYLVPLVATAALLGSPEQAGRCLLGGTLVAAPAGLWGAARGLGLRWRSRLPWWLRPLPGAVAAGIVAVLTVGVVALVVAVVLGFDQVRGLSVASSTEPLASVVLVLAQLAYLPNLVLWTVSYALGAGFTVGTDSLVSPVVTELGLLPGFPVLGALPAEGVGAGAQALWLLSGALAGAVAAAALLRSLHRDGPGPGLRPDLAALVGGLAGVLTGLVVTLLGVVSGGDLGTGRLVDLGPRVGELAVMSVTVMGLAGMLTGLVVGVVGLRRRGWERAEATVSLERSATAVRAASTERGERTVVLRRR